MDPTSITLGGILCVLAVVWAVAVHKMENQCSKKAFNEGLIGACLTFVSGISLAHLVDDLIKGESAAYGAFVFALEFIPAIIAFCEWVVFVNRPPEE